MKTFKGRPKQILLIAVVTLLSSSAIAETMVCRNPRREYGVTFDHAARRMLLKTEEGITQYKVLAVEKGAQKLVVAGVVGLDSNLAFRATFSGPKKIEFLENNNIIQIDKCR